MLSWSAPSRRISDALQYTEDGSTVAQRGDCDLTRKNLLEIARFGEDVMRTFWRVPCTYRLRGQKTEHQGAQHVHLPTVQHT